MSEPASRVVLVEARNSGTEWIVEADGGVVVDLQDALDRLAQAGWSLRAVGHTSDIVQCLFYEGSGVAPTESAVIYELPNWTDNAYDALLDEFTEAAIPYEQADEGVSVPARWEHVADEIVQRVTSAFYGSAASAGLFSQHAPPQDAPPQDAPTDLL